MNSMIMILKVLMGFVSFFFGLMIACFLASFAGVPHPELWGTVAWLLLLGFLTTKAIDSAKAERLARLNIVQASIEAQAREERDATRFNPRSTLGNMN